MKSRAEGSYKNGRLNKTVGYYEGLVLFFLLMIFLFAAPYFSVAKAPSEKTEYNQKIIDLCVNRVSGGDLNWELKADEAMVRGNMEHIRLRKINLHYFIVPGKDVFMEGERAEVYFPDSLISIQGGVRAESELGLSLETESLVWNGEERFITTKDWVVIRRLNLEMCGQGLEADLDLERIKIESDAKTTIY
ncbi:MAG: LPS export ABC transporter periplasmic protein LptC [bacterium]